MTTVSMTVNGRSVSGDVEDRTLLVSFLRETLGMTGTHVGCDTTQCGACVVHMDGRAVKSCTVLVGQADGAEITTIEGLAKGDELHPMQAAFREHHGLQCGFCTPGMIMSAADLLTAMRILREVEDERGSAGATPGEAEPELPLAPAAKSEAARTGGDPDKPIPVGSVPTGVVTPFSSSRPEKKE